MKPGFTSSEFAAMVIGVVLSALVAWGRISRTDADTLQTALVDAIPNVIAIAGTVLLVWRYIEGRVSQKLKVLDQQAAAAAAAPPVLPFNEGPHGV